MFQRGIRGAITVKENSAEEISSAVCELVCKMLEENNIVTENISHVIFSMTDDLDVIYPAKPVRENIEGFNFVPMMCLSEQKINNSLKMCLRVLIVVNTDISQKAIKHIYLRDAKKLRVDISDAQT